MGAVRVKTACLFRGYQDDEGFYESGFLHIDNHWEWTNGFEVHTGLNFTREGVRSRLKSLKERLFLWVSTTTKNRRLW